MPVTKRVRWWLAAVAGALILSFGLVQLFDRPTEPSQAARNVTQAILKKIESPDSLSAATVEQESKPTLLNNATAREFERLRQRLLNEIVPLLYAS
jgi:hypothetical protein